MITTFKKIRKSTLFGNFGKYLLYAIGEILLVMIGILLAFQVNKWNENRINQELEINLIYDIYLGLQGDLQDIKANQEAHSRFFDNQIKSIEWLENHTQLNDSVINYFSIAHKSTSFLNSRAAFESLKEFGLHKITNDTLRYSITYLYDVQYPDFGKIHTLYHTLLNETLNIGLIHFQDWSYKKGINLMRPVNINKLRQDRQYLMKLKHLKKINELLLSQNLHLGNSVDFLIKQIEKSTTPR